MTAIHRKVKSTIKLTKREIPHDISRHDSKLEIENPNKTIILSNGPDVALLRDENRRSCEDKEEKLKTCKYIRLVVKFLIDTHSESQNILPKSESKTELHPSVAGKSLIS